MVKDAREFLLAIKESTHTVFDEDAVEFLELLREQMSQSLDARHIEQYERDSILFFEGMLRGVQVQLTRNKQHEAARLADLGLLKPDA